MTFREFNEKAETPLQRAILELIMQPRGKFSVKEKQFHIGKIIKLYADAYRELTGQDATASEVAEVLRLD